MEKLLLELQDMPEEGSQLPQADRTDGFRRTHSNGNLNEEQGASLEDTRSRLLERVAGELNRLKFYVARAQVCYHKVFPRACVSLAKIINNLQYCVVVSPRIEANF